MKRRTLLAATAALPMAVGACAPLRPGGPATRDTMLGDRTMFEPAGATAAAARPSALPSPWPHPTLCGQVPLVIAHRGASGERPEHTLAGYALAIERGADYIEPDLVCTRDGVLVARHDAELSVTTDVASRPEFAARRRTQRVDGAEQTGWFVEDFTLAELRTLRARERFAALRPESAAHDGRYPIPTFAEVIELAQDAARRTGRRVGVYPETKHAAHFRRIGLALEPRVVETLATAGWTREGDPVFIQSFEPSSLKRLADLTALPLVQLIAERGAPADAAGRGTPTTYADLVSPSGLLEVSTYADALGVAKALIAPRAGGADASPDLVARAHDAGLFVHAWTFRNEDRFLPTDLRGRPGEELARALRAGVDGLFCDYPGAGVAAVRAVAGDRANRQAGSSTLPRCRR